jgi:hypothetical protein
MKIDALTFQLLDYQSKIDQSDQNVIRMTSIESSLHYPTLDIQDETNELVTRLNSLFTRSTEISHPPYQY